MDDLQRREFHDALLDARALEDLPGKWQAAIMKAVALRPRRPPACRVVAVAFAMGRR
jgi:hypothetical protein